MTRRRTVGARTGGRSHRVVSDVLRAAFDELNRVGYGALRVEDVAARAGVNKTTVYRRWPTKAALVVAALRASALHDEALPDTGSVRRDLLAMLEQAIAFGGTPEGRALTRLITTECGDPEVDRLVRSLRDEILAQRKSIVERAVLRGELPRGVDSRLVVDAIFAPVVMRVMRLREDVDAATAEAFVDVVITGIEHGAGQVGRSRPANRGAIGDGS